MPKHTETEIDIVATIEDLNELRLFVNDIENKNLEWDVFQKKYKDIKSLIPKHSDFVKLKRNQCIKSDYKIGISKDSISELYDIPIECIEKILNKEN